MLIRTPTRAHGSRAPFMVSDHSMPEPGDEAWDGLALPEHRSHLQTTHLYTSRGPAPSKGLPTSRGKPRHIFSCLPPMCPVYRTMTPSCPQAIGLSTSGSQPWTGSVRASVWKPCLSLSRPRLLRALLPLCRKTALGKVFVCGRFERIVLRAHSSAQRLVRVQCQVNVGQINGC